MLRSRLLELLSPICLTYFYSQTERVFLTQRGYPGTISCAIGVDTNRPYERWISPLPAILYFILGAEIEVIRSADGESTE
jgi:hypothetical protein